MSIPEESVKRSDNSRRTVLIIVSVIAAVAVAGLIYLLMRASGGGPPETAQRLEGALRPGNPEFEQVKDRIVLDPPEAMEGTRPVGDVWMELQTTVRNFTGRTITGLELKGSVVDLNGAPVKERTVVVIPTRQPELENNKTMKTSIVLDSISKEAVRANIKIEVTGVKF